MEAVRCAIAIQTEIEDRNGGFPDHRRMNFRIGVNLGDVMAEGDNLFGAGVNIAARLEEIAEPGAVCISAKVYDEVKGKIDRIFVDGGDHRVKNIAAPIHVWHWSKASGDEGPIRSHEAMALPDEPSIVVLPFTNMSGDPEQEYFSDGITEDIITALSRIPRLFVVARHSTSVYKGKAVDIRQVGQEQGVRFVLEGSVRKSGDRVRITGQLIDATTGNHRWADHYDRKLDDIFAVQDEITRNVTVAVQVELTAGEEARLWAGGTNDIEAWECVVRGSEYANRHTHEDNQEARRLAERALSLDAKYSNAWALCALTHFEDAMWDWSSSREASLSMAEEAANQAVELEELSPDGYSSLAYVKSEQAQFDEAVEIARKAVSLSPHHASNAAMYSAILARAGDYQAAFQQVNRAIRLSPIYPTWYLHILGIASFALGDDEQAVRVYRASIRSFDPDSAFMPIVKVWLAICLASAGREAEARREVADVFRIDPDFRIDDWWRSPRKDWSVRDRAVAIWNKVVSP